MRQRCRWSCVYGVPLIFINVLLEQLGVPVPAVPALIVAGALSATEVVIDARATAALFAPSSRLHMVPPRAPVRLSDPADALPHLAFA